MTPAWLRHFANALLVLSAYDAGLSLLDEALGAAFAIDVLHGARMALARGVALALLAALPAMLLTPRLPLRVFGPLALGTLWLTLGAAPLPLWIPPAAMGAAGSAIQLALVGAAFALVRRHNGDGRWLFHEGSPARPAFAWQRCAALAAGVALLGPPLGVAYFGVALATSLELLTRGFVQFDLEGVSLADRRYARAGRAVRLVGMMHVGEERAYRELVASFATPDTVVLTEGVSDREARLAGALSYGRAARALGLQPQQDLRYYLLDDEDWDAPLPEWPHMRPADVDAASFAPETLEWIAWAGELWASESVLAALRAVLLRAQLQDPEQWETVQADILDARNTHLIAELGRALEDYTRVIVPWGALHLPAVEQALLADGFAPTRDDRRRLASWSTIAAALF